MAETPSQNYASHRRYDFWWHGPGFLIVTIGIVAAAVHAWRHSGWFNWWMVVYAVGILLVVFRARTQTLTVQNRVIRLEMRTHLRETLPPVLAARLSELTLSQLIGLRFASNAELPGLVERCLSGELANGEAVKKAIRDWQSDFVRA